MFRVLKSKTWYPAKLGDITYHPACTKPDKQSDEDYKRLLEDIKANGIRTPIQVQAGTNVVVSGRHRIKAAKEAGVPIPVEEIEITDAECWSLSASELCHRNLAPARAASLYLDMKAELEKATKAEHKANEKEAEESEEDDKKPGKKSKAKKEKPERKRGKRGEGKKTKREAAEAGVTPAMMERVKKVRAKGIPAIWKAMDAEEITANDAAYIVDFDHDVQREALALVREKKASTLKAAKTILDKQARAEAGPALRDAKNREVPKELIPVFEDRGEFTILRENLHDLSKRFARLLKRDSAKYIPKALATHLDDIVQALDIYQPYAIAENNDGWVTKRVALGK